jgi:hypothetical protein
MGLDLLPTRHVEGKYLHGATVVHTVEVHAIMGVSQMTDRLWAGLVGGKEENSLGSRDKELGLRMDTMLLVNGASGHPLNGRQVTHCKCF